MWCAVALLDDEIRVAMSSVMGYGDERAIRILIRDRTMGKNPSRTGALLPASRGAWRRAWSSNASACLSSVMGRLP